ncbi:hypothetical protein G6F43_013383 [Rhizopus delemar]|nr:hypothetical protein G6F43_013383 [Rhizopus delemar]
MNNSEKQGSNDEFFSMEVDVYLKRVYIEQGYEAAMVATIDFLKMWESCNVGPKNLTYEVDGVILTREDYAIHVIDGIKLCVHGETMRKESLETSWEEEDDMELLNNVEGLISEQYQQYTTTIREIEERLILRDTLCDTLATNIRHWAHFRFAKPRSTKESVGIYSAIKQTMLKTILPGYSFHRALSNKIKQVDPWTRIVGDSSRGAGICNENGNEDAQRLAESSQKDKKN